ncbi:hypothetical protein DFH29DRAFT_928008 [Suillus ampliporus]|nr:hypothetical protein DFH29DRAFT_928008 [Suillus ampliporus]
MYTPAQSRHAHTACNLLLLAVIIRTIDTIGKCLGLRNISESSVPSDLNESRIDLSTSDIRLAHRLSSPVPSRNQ